MEYFSLDGELHTGEVLRVMRLIPWIPWFTRMIKTVNVIDSNNAAIPAFITYSCCMWKGDIKSDLFILDDHSRRHLNHFTRYYVITWTVTTNFTNLDLS